MTYSRRGVFGLISAGMITIPALAETPQGMTEVVVDIKTPELFQYSHNAEKKQRPASLVKLMTVYLLLIAIREKRVSLNTTIVTSLEATKQEPTKVWLKEGEKFTVHEALCALVVKSANDVAYATAEFLAEGSHQQFVLMMNDQAKNLGMSDTHYLDASGLSDSLDQHSTAANTALLMSRIIQDFPFEYAIYFSRTEYYWRGKSYERNDRNRIFERTSIDGMKTGYTRKARFNVAASYYVSDGVHKVMVIMKAPSYRTRLTVMKKLIIV